MNISNIITQLRSFSSEDLIRSDLGQMSFAKEAPKLISVKSMLVKMAEIINSSSVLLDEQIPEELVYATEGFIVNFIELAKVISDFSFSVSQEGLREREAIIYQINILCNNYLVSTNGGTANFLLLFSTIVSFDDPVQRYSYDINPLVESLKNQSDKIETDKEELDKLKSETVDLFNKLTQKATEQTTRDFSELFKKESDKAFKSANWWLAIVILATFLFFVFLVIEDRILPLDYTTATTATFSYLRRILTISFCIYIITFLLKQYNIKKHLETLNRHRQNTLDSFELFIKSLGNSDQNLKDRLMMEVAKAIYESGQTGYINVKDEGGSTSSIFEVTKMIKPE